MSLAQHYKNHLALGLPTTASGITNGSVAGQVPVWDGDSWEPASTLSGILIPRTNTLTALEALVAGSGDATAGELGVANDNQAIVAVHASGAGGTATYRPAVRLAASQTVNVATEAELRAAIANLDKAIYWASDPDYTVDITLTADITLTSELQLPNTPSMAVTKLRAAEVASYTMSAVTATGGSAGARTITCTFASTTGLAAGDVLVCDSTSGGVNPQALIGAFTVDAVISGTSARLMSASSAASAVPSGAVAGTFTKLRRLSTNASSEIRPASGTTLRIENLAIDGNNVGQGLSLAERNANVILTGKCAFVDWTSAPAMTEGTTLTAQLLYVMGGNGLPTPSAGGRVSIGNLYQNGGVGLFALSGSVEVTLLRAWGLSDGFAHGTLRAAYGDVEVRACAGTAFTWFGGAVVSIGTSAFASNSTDFSGTKNTISADGLCIAP